MADDSCHSTTGILLNTLSRRRLLTSAALLILPVIPQVTMAATILAVRTWPAEEYTRVTLELDTELKVDHFMLEHPYRMVVDIHGLTMSKAVNELVSKIKPNDPYIASIRAGQNRPHVIRLVIDLKQAVAPQIFTLKPVGGYKYRLVMDLYPKIAQDPLMALTENGGDQDPLAAVLEQLARESDSNAPIPSVPGQRLPPKTAQTPPSPMPPPIGLDRPILVALDPGHGGEDSGAIGPHGTMEKNVVLAIGRRLKKMIDSQSNMRAYLTRDGDYFVPLHVRVQKARRVKADLFMSIHADASTNRSASGSSVFALSQHGATSTAARWMAKRENDADLIGGINLGAHDQQVAKVLLDLSTAAQISDAMRVGSYVLTELAKINTLHGRRVERAGFAVLKAPDIPSILVETAFISNPTGERHLRSPDYQEKIASAMLGGIQEYFASKPALARRA